MKKFLIAGCALVAVIVVGLTAYLIAQDRQPASGGMDADVVRRNSTRNRTTTQASKILSPTKSPAKKGAASGKKKKILHQKIAYADRADLSNTEKRQLVAIEDALENEDFSALTKLLPDVYSSANDEIRSEMVDALGWFGEEAMAELLPFMADRVEEIAQTAIDNWTTALADVSENVTVSPVEIDDDIDTPGLDQADFRYSVTDSQNNLIFLVLSFMGI